LFCLSSILSAQDLNPSSRSPARVSGNMDGIPGSYHSLAEHPPVFTTAAKLKDLVSRINRSRSYSMPRFGQLADKAGRGLLLTGRSSPASAANRGSLAPPVAPKAAAVDPTAAVSPLVFDVSYYKQVNPDLAGLSDADAQAHWINQGVDEGRRAHPLFWTQQYLAYYPDLQAAFGAQNYAAALEHYVSTGHTEGRSGVLALASTVFDVTYYKQANPDLASLSDTDAETHWIEHGISENRHGHPRFYALDYLFLNYDKALLYGTAGGVDSINDYALKGANDHVFTYSSDGRIGLDALMPLVFDPAYYMKQHPELNFQSTDEATSFWLQTGLSRGDKGSNVFSAAEYLALYPDLAQAFGATGYSDALEHYVRIGRSEGRSGLFAIDQSYLSFIPTSAGLTTTPADRVETFTSVTGQDITVTILAPAPASDTIYTMRPINPGELPDDYFPLAVASAQTAGAGTLMIPKGVYNFQGTDPNVHWFIDGLTDMTIDGQGSTLNFSNPGFGILMNNATRVVFKNFVLDWPHLRIAALGRIIAGPHNGPNQLQIDPAYPDDGSKSIEVTTPWDVTGNTWGRQTETEEFFSTDGSGSPPPVYEGNGLYSSPAFVDYPAGIALLVRYYATEGVAMWVEGVQDFALENVTVHSAPNTAFFFDRGRGIRVSNCTVNRSSGKLISASRGALQVNQSSGDVLVENSVFAYHGDDGINIGAASFFPVEAVSGDQLTLAESDSTPQPGDPVIIFNSAFGVLGFSSIQAVSPNAGGGFNVQLSQEVPHVASDSWLGRLNYMGARWIVRNNQFLNNHARAILPQGPYGLLKNNVMIGQTHAAILAGILNDVPPAVGPGVQDMQVLNNWISDSGPFSTVPWILRGGTSPGAIMIVSWLINGFNFNDESESTDVRINQHIVLSGNTVQNVPGPAFFIGSASDVSMDGNQIINANSGPSYYLGTGSTSGSVVVSQAQNVSITNTAVSGTQTGPVSIDLHSTNGIQNDRGTTLALSLAAGSNPSAFGQPLAFAAVVTTPSGGTPTGTVQFSDGITNLGSAVTLSPDGTATFTTSSLSLGQHAINAVYSGDVNFDASPSQLMQTVSPEASVTTLASSSNPSASGAPLTLSAAVSSYFGGMLTGSVQFQDGGVDLGSPVPLSSGVASLPAAGLSVGAHSITAVYFGNPDFVSSTSAPLPQVVTATGGANSTSASLTAPAQTFFRQSATFTVAVNSGGGTPSGSVILLDGNTQLGPVLTLDGGGAASYSTPLRPGVHQIQAIYIGNDNFNGSSSGLTVNTSPRPKPR
jgi:hypothetical protein